MKVLLIDNYDSFTYNIVHLLRDCGVAADDIIVLRNTEVQPSDLAGFDAVISSPGPGLPEDSGALLPCVQACLAEQIPYLGVCLGHQALGMALGGRLLRLDQVQHGVQHLCSRRAQNPLLTGLSQQFEVGRYHSWVVDPSSLPAGAEVLAISESDGVIQAICARDSPAFGVQFHPESIMSVDAGPQIMRNFLNMAEAVRTGSKLAFAHA